MRGHPKIIGTPTFRDGALIKGLVADMVQMAGDQCLPINPWKFGAAEEECDKAVHAGPCGLRQCRRFEVVAVAHGFEQIVEDRKAAHAAFMNRVLIRGLCGCLLEHEGDAIGGALIKPEGDIFLPHAPQALLGSAR